MSVVDWMEYNGPSVVLGLKWTIWQKIFIPHYNGSKGHFCSSKEGRKLLCFCRKVINLVSGDRGLAYASSRGHLNRVSTRATSILVIENPTTTVTTIRLTRNGFNIITDSISTKLFASCTFGEP